MVVLASNHSTWQAEATGTLCEFQPSLVNAVSSQTTRST